MTSSNRNSYDTGASADAQGNLQTVIAQLETVLNTRDSQVKAAMADFTADGVSDEYHGKELQWKNAASEVRTIITLLKKVLHENDSTAQATLARAKSAVGGIG